MNATAPLRRTPAESAGGEPSDRAGRVLDHVEARLADGGVRSVVMSEVARDLSMSTKTLYREFPTKDALITAILQRWVQRFTAARDQATAVGAPPAERIAAAAIQLSHFRARFSESFWNEVREDHPDAWRAYAEAVAGVQRTGRSMIASQVRPGLPAEVLAPLLAAVIERATTDDVRAASGLSTEDAIRAAVDVWAHGALAD